MQLAASPANAGAERSLTRRRPGPRMDDVERTDSCLSLAQRPNAFVAHLPAAPVVQTGSMTDSSDAAGTVTPLVFSTCSR
jgi:hypothetical protein